MAESSCNDAKERQYDSIIELRIKQLKRKEHFNEELTKWTSIIDKEIIRTDLNIEHELK